MPCCPGGPGGSMTCQGNLVPTIGTELMCFCAPSATPPTPPPTDNTAAIVTGVALALGLAGLVYLDTTRGYY
jgi:hypothetical protein